MSDHRPDHDHDHDHHHHHESGGFRPGMDGSDRSSSWIPVVGPLFGGVLGALAFQLLFTNGPLGT